MAVFIPFKAYRPKPELAAEIAAKPYDVLNSEEARQETKDNPLSFLHIGKPEVDLDPTIDLYNPLVYEKGRQNLQNLISQGALVADESPYFYVYSQTMDGRTQYGLVGCASVQDYLDDVIKKHEKTRKDKEEDRCNHVRITNAHSGPIFLTYPDNQEINNIVNSIIFEMPDNDHFASDGIRHCSWLIRDDETITRIKSIFSKIPNLYVADGHHRSAAAAIVGNERKNANPNHNGNEEYNFFLAVLFPASQLYIMDYNRLVKDLNGLSEESYFNALSAKFSVEPSSKSIKPNKKGCYGMYINRRWYTLTANDSLFNIDDPVEKLDVSILQKHVLSELLGIEDPRTSKRIDFVGGIRGLTELERRVDSGEMKIAFSMFPTSIHELISIADSGKVMPPKSTWFEPKLRDGLFVHFLD
ncbi:MAG: DUF1015 family protein [Candidatus Kapabacteria bacterium]|nr:DUF1015 family protein [Candidatus Kapabacteria bacterium]